MALTLAETVAVQQCTSQRLLGRGLSQPEVNAVMQDVGYCLQLVTTGEGPDPPDPPDPPLPPLTCRAGYLDLDGWWDSYCGDERRNFETRGDVGVMFTNAQAVRHLTADKQRYQSGLVRFEVFFATARVPQGRGGLHICSTTSAHVALGDTAGVYSYPGWFRPDFQLVPGADGAAGLRIGTYNTDGDGRRWFLRGGNYDVVVDVWNTPVMLTPGRWIELSFGWDREGDNVVYRLNGAAHGLAIHPDTLDFYGFSVGNMDDLELDGGAPEVRFRNWRVET